MNSHAKKRKAVRMPDRVIKLGGSLLGQADLHERFEYWRRLHPSGPQGQPGLDWVIVGGGELVNALRRLQPLQQISDFHAHVAAMRLMDMNVRFLARSWGNLAVTSLALWVVGLRERSAQRNSESPGDGGLVFLQTAKFFRMFPPQGMPKDWRVTSDSMAAYVAAFTGAELALCKSAPPPAECGSDKEGAELLTAWSKAGYVDEWFPSAVAGVRNVSVVNLASKSSWALRGR